jgi:hypothetical protein
MPHLSAEIRADLEALAEGSASNPRKTIEKILRWAEVQFKTSSALGKQAEMAAPAFKEQPVVLQIALKLREASASLEQAAKSSLSALTKSKK